MKRLHFFYQLQEIPVFFYQTKETNKYYDFLEQKYKEFFVVKTSLTFKEFSKQYELHHIVPMHAGGKNTLHNLMPLTPTDHALAHRYRYEVYQKFGDFSAWNLRKNSEASSRALTSDKFQRIREAQLAKWKEEKAFFYDSEWQKAQALKSVEARKGQYFGGPQWYQSQKAKQAQRNGGVAAQSEHTKMFLTKFSEWQHLPSQTKIFLGPAVSLRELHKQLQVLVPNPMFQNKHMSLLTSGARRTLHGWQILRVFLEPLTENDRDSQLFPNSVMEKKSSP